MRFRPLVITLLAVSFTLPALFAQQAVPEGQMPPPPAASPPAEAMKTPPAGAAANEDAVPDPAMEAVSDDAEEAPKPMLDFMRQRMEEMITGLDTIEKASGPEERQRLMLELRQKMVALNAMMLNMTQPGPRQSANCPMMGMNPGMGQGMGHGMGQGMGHGMGQGMGHGMGQGMRGPEAHPMMAHGPGGDRFQGACGLMNQKGCPGMVHDPEKPCGLMRPAMRGYDRDDDWREAFEQLAKRVDLLQNLLEDRIHDYR